MGVCEELREGQGGRSKVRGGSQTGRLAGGRALQKGQGATQGP